MLICGMSGLSFGMRVAWQTWNFKKSGLICNENAMKTRNFEKYGMMWHEFLKNMAWCDTNFFLNSIYWMTAYLFALIFSVRVLSSKWTSIKKRQKNLKKKWFQIREKSRVKNLRTKNKDGKMKRLKSNWLITLHAATRYGTTE